MGIFPLQKVGIFTLQLTIFLLLYPGVKNIGLNSDSIAYYLIFILEIQHGFGFYIIQRGIVKYLKR